MDQALIRKDQDIELDKKITSIDGKFDELLKELHDREKDKCTTHHLKILEETTKLITRLENMEETFEEMSDILAVLSDKAKGYDPKRNELMNRDIIIIRKQVQILVDRMESMKTGGGTEEAKQALKSLSKLLGVDTGRSRLDNFEEE